MSKEESIRKEVK